MRAALLPVLLVVFLASCAAAPEPVPRSFLTGRDPRFPPARFLIGIGEGRSLEGARRQAVVAIASQLRARVRASDTVTSEAWHAEDGNSRSSEALSQDIRIESRFDRPEWIRLVDSHVDRDGTIRVLCALDRAQAAAVLGAEIEVARAAIRLRTESLANEEDPWALSEGLADAKRRRRELLGARALLEAIEGRTAPPAPELREVDALASHLATVRARLVVRICVEPSSEASGALDLPGRFTAMLAGQGIRSLPCDAPPSEEPREWRLSGKLDAATELRPPVPGGWQRFCAARLDFRLESEGDQAIRLGGSEAGIRSGGATFRDACGSSLQGLVEAFGRRLGLRDEASASR